MPQPYRYIVVELPDDENVRETAEDIFDLLADRDPSAVSVQPATRDGFGHFVFNHNLHPAITETDS